jgi:uncharacterized protein YkwD
VAGLVALLAGCLSPQQQTGLNALNADRIANGRAGLMPDGYLANKAQAWADQLARDGYLHHSSLPAGVPNCWTELGENVGYGGSIAAVENAYMHSAPHRANILNGAFTKGAVGVAIAGGRVYTVQEFMAGC